MTTIIIAFRILQKRIKRNWEARFHASADVKMRSALFWGFAQRTVATNVRYINPRKVQISEIRILQKDSAQRIQ
jgi:hypothetical protein